MATSSIASVTAASQGVFNVFNVDACIKAASLRLQYQIEVTAASALQECCGKHDKTGVQNAMKRMKDESPLFVEIVEIHGCVWQDMYDDHPGFAYFDSPGMESTTMPAYCSLNKAMAIAVQMLHEGQQAVKDKDYYDGLFCPNSIVLRDQFGNVVQEYTNRFIGHGNGGWQTGWLTQFPSEQECGALEATAHALSVEASEEARWDNFNSARGLRKKASELRSRVSIAKLNHRIVL